MHVAYGAGNPSKLAGPENGLVPGCAGYSRIHIHISYGSGSDMGGRQSVKLTG